MLNASPLGYHLYPDDSKVTEDIMSQAEQECKQIQLFQKAEKRRDYSFESCLNKPLKYPDSYFKHLEKVKELEAEIKNNPDLNKSPFEIPF